MTESTTLSAFLEYSNRLTESLERLEQVIGLVFVGSAADTSRVDQWSDHDFFVITHAGTAEELRQNLSWLPNHEQIAMCPRETAHGLKVIYQNGQVLEFAVFEESELELASANAYSVAIDKANIGDRIAAIAARSGKSAFDFDTEFELMLSHYLIGVGRARRGEVLTAGETIRNTCVTHLLGLIRHSIRPAEGTALLEDNLNRLRRFELQYPEIGARLAAALALPVEESAKAQCDLVTDLLPLNSAQMAKADLVKQLLGWD